MIDLETIKNIETINEKHNWKLIFKEGNDSIICWIDKKRFNKYNLTIEANIGENHKQYFHEKLEESVLIPYIQDHITHTLNSNQKLEFEKSQLFTDRKNLFFVKHLKHNYWYVHLGDDHKSLWIFIEETKKGFVITHEISNEEWTYSTQEILKETQTSTLNFIDRKIIPSFNKLTGSSVYLD